MPDITYPLGGGGPWPARKAEEPKREPTTMIALCDGAIYIGPQSGLAEANALAADRLIERIAKRVVEMQAEQTRAARMYAEALVSNVRYWGEVQAGKRPAPMAGPITEASRARLHPNDVTFVQKYVAPDVDLLPEFKP